MMLEVALLMLVAANLLMWFHVRHAHESAWRAAKAVNKSNYNQLSDVVHKLYLDLERHLHRIEKRYDKVHIDSKIAEKFAERAHNTSSATAIGLGIVQKSLATPRIATVQALKQAALADKQLKQMFGGEPFDWNLEEADYSDDEKDVLKKAQDHYNQFLKPNGEDMSHE